MKFCGILRPHTRDRHTDLFTQGPHSHILMTGRSDRGSHFIPKKIPTSEFVYPKKSLLLLAYPKKTLSVFASANFFIFLLGNLKHANVNFGFGQKQNYTKPNTKSSHDCNSVSSSYLLRQLYRKIFIMTSTACLVLSKFFACYCTETSLRNRPQGIRLFTMFLCN